MGKDKTLAERSRRLRAKRKADGLVLFRAWVTPEDAAQLRRVVDANWALDEVIRRVETAQPKE